MEPWTYHELNTPIGRIQMTIQQGDLVKIVLGKNTRKYLNASPPPKDIENLSSQIAEYLSGKRDHFDTSLWPSGTEFEKAVWKETSKIPYGKVKTYSEIAKAVGKPAATRAVGNALGRNPLPLLIPCHRVVSKMGLGGYSCGLNIKKKLLMLEAGQQTLNI